MTTIRATILIAVAMLGCSGGKKPADKPVVEAPAAPKPDAPAPEAEKAPDPPPVEAPKPAPTVTFEAVPEGWTLDEEPNRMTLVVAVNETKFPVDNALFRVEFGLEDEAAPKDAKGYAAWLATAKSFQVTKTTKAKGGTYFESKDAFRYALEVAGKRVWCGGSLYKNADYNKIPKIRDASVTAAKKLCAGVKPA
jgi:hypothetical protein